MEEALNRELSLQRGDSIDKFMPTEAVMEKAKKVDKSRDKQIAALDQNDPEYEQKKDKIERMAKQTKYKLMKHMNTRNEKVPKEVKANMIRRASI